MAIAPAAPPPSTVGSQAPEKPASDVVKGPAEHRRDVIRKAFQRTSEPEAAKPQMGHNQPPEPMEQEKATPPLDLKKKPTEQAGSDAPRPRAEHGHFAPNAPKATAETAAPGRQQAGLAGHLASLRLPQHGTSCSCLRTRAIATRRGAGASKRRPSGRRRRRACAPASSA